LRNPNKYKIKKGIGAFGIGFAYSYVVFDDKNVYLIVAFSALIIA